MRHSGRVSLASHAVVFRRVVFHSPPQTPAYPRSTFLSHCFIRVAIRPMNSEVLSYNDQSE